MWGRMMLDDELIEWGRWVRQDYHGLEAQSHWLMMMRDNTHTMRPTPANMTDERALAIDKAVCALATHSLLLYELFWRYYVSAHSLRHLSAYLYKLRADGKYQGACSANSANALLNNATGYIAGVLNA